MFFWDKGDWFNVAKQMYFSPTRWEGGAWGSDQCSWTSYYMPGNLWPYMLVKQKIQLADGNYFWERDHMRLWDGTYNGGPEGHWSIGAVHHENADWGEQNHCLTPHDPEGSSFDYAEYVIWAQTLQRYQHWFFRDAYNQGYYPTCSNARVWNDGMTVGIQITN